MVKKLLFKFMVVITGLLLSSNLWAEEIPPITIHVQTPGTLSSLIPSSKKYQIENLTLTGSLNGTDIRYIREMAGRDEEGYWTSGHLSVLNLAGVNFYSGGNSFYRSGSTYYYSTNGSIASYAFFGCSLLTSVTIPNSVTSIGSNAFSGCKSLTSINIGVSDVLISTSAFIGCTGLKEFIVSEQNTRYSSIDGVIFYKDKSTIVLFPKGKAGSYTIPNSVDFIGAYAFSGCTELTSVTIPNSVTAINQYSFSGCTGLTSIPIPNSVSYIGDYAFSGCTGLTSVTIPNKITSIYGHVFSGCTGLTSVTMPNSVASIYEYAFSGCTGLTSVTIPNSVALIYEYAFSGCTGLTSVTIPNSVTSIGASAFEGCRKLTSVIIPNSVTSIGGSAFKDCIGLTSLTISNGVTSIGVSAFEDCIGLTNITIPNSVTSIGDSAFSGCKGITEIHCKNSNPITISWGVFVLVYHATLYVPKGSYASYWIANNWGDFKRIIEEDETAINTIKKDNITIQSISNGIAIETKEQISVLVSNLSGQIVYQSLINGNTEIPLNKGVYVLRVNNESQKVIVK